MCLAVKDHVQEVQLTRHLVGARDLVRHFFEHADRVFVHFTIRFQDRHQRPRIFHGIDQGLFRNEEVLEFLHQALQAQQEDVREQLSAYLRDRSKVVDDLVVRVPARLVRGAVPPGGMLQFKDSQCFLVQFIHVGHVAFVPRMRNPTIDQVHHVQCVGDRVNVSFDACVDWFFLSFGDFMYI